MIQKAKAGGFTLIEVMVVVAIVGITATTAIFMIKPDGYTKSARGVAERVGSLMDIARERSVATRRYHRLRVSASQVSLQQATTTGLVAPTTWQEVEVFVLPEGSRVMAANTRAHTQSADSVPADGNALPLDLDFLPDGTADISATVFVGAAKDRVRARALVYAASGTVMVYDSW